jgi:hypothetical protein
MAEVLMPKGYMFEYEGIPSATLADKRFPTADAAAKWAASVFNPASIEDDREFGGAIYHDPENNDYYVTYNPAEQGKGTIIAAREKGKTSHKVAAHWHTHGKPIRGAERMSQQDMQSALANGVPMYMADGSGRISKFTPGEDNYRGKAQKMPALEENGRDVKLRTMREQIIHDPSVGRSKDAFVKARSQPSIGEKIASNMR